jgi:UDP-glucose-4-epimerase GalE
MTVLVTGGAGYIGSHTVRLLRQLERDVIVLDTLELGNKEAVLGAPLVVGDIANAEQIEEVVRRYDVDAVIHFAAYKSVAESMHDPHRYFANNVAGSESMVATLGQLGVNRIVFSSSCSVYGTPDHIPVSESAPLRPESVYAETKAMIERTLAWYGRLGGIQSVSLRYFNAAGASSDAVIGEDWQYSINLVPLVMKSLLGRHPAVDVFGTDYPTPDGTAIRDYVHVEDLAEAHVRALDYLAAGGSTTVLNLGTGVGSTVQQVIDATERIAGQPVPRNYVGRRPGDPTALYSDNQRVHAVLGWSPTKGLDEIIESALRWHSKTRER